MAAGDISRAQVEADLKDIDKVLAGSAETRDKLDHTLQAYARLERACAEKGRQVAAANDLALAVARLAALSRRNKLNHIAVSQGLERALEDYRKVTRA
jgi:hypothetical protein